MQTKDLEDLYNRTTEAPATEAVEAVANDRTQEGQSEDYPALDTAEYTVDELNQTAANAATSGKEIVVSANAPIGQGAIAKTATVEFKEHDPSYVLTAKQVSVNIQTLRDLKLRTG